MPVATTPLACEPGRRRRGSLESEDLPVALHTEPLAEGGFVAKSLVVVLIAVLVLTASALAASAKVRIEGKIQLLFGMWMFTVTDSIVIFCLEDGSIVGELF